MRNLFKERVANHDVPEFLIDHYIDNDLADLDKA